MASIFEELSRAEYKPLDRETERELILRAKAGDESAKRKLVEHNLRYVAKMASRYARPGSDKYMELISAGVIGLYDAIEKFDPDRGTRFLTFASTHVFHHMYKELIFDLSPFSMSSSERRVITHVYRIVPELEKELGRPPTVDEVYDRLKSEVKVSVSKEFVKDVMEKKHIPVPIPEQQD